MRRILGCILMLLPFVGIFIVLLKTGGLRDALFIFAGATVIAGCVIGGTYLLIMGDCRDS